MCSPFKDNSCQAELEAFNDTRDFDTCKAFLAKHTKFQIAMFVGLLVDAAYIVTKKLNFSQN